jgi:hypothetical protein
VIAHAGGPLEADSFDPRLQQLRRMSFTDACHRWNIQTVYEAAGADRLLRLANALACPGDG